MTSIPEKEFTPDYYNEDYFKTPDGKKYRNADGSLSAWSYRNPTGDNAGCGPIVKAWQTMFQPKTMLDIGAGRGTLLAYAREIGIEAVGFDFSKWAVNEGRFARCKPEWFIEHDATKPFPYTDRAFDLTVALDLFEHIYMPDLPNVISEMFRVSKKWIFLQIAVAGSGGLQGRDENGYILERGKPVPVEYEGCAAAGHVTLRKESWWYEQFEHEDWMPRKDMVNWFISLVPEGIIHNWLLNSMIIMERI